MKGRGALFVCVVALTGLFVPVEQFAGVPEWVQQRSGADPLREKRCAVAAPVTSEELERAIAEASGELEAFHQAWGRPPIPPPGWDPEEEEQMLRTTLEAFPSELSAVSCEFFPCVVLIAGEDRIERDVVEEAFDVPAAAVGLATSAGHREVQTITIAAIDTTALDERESWWVARVQARLAGELGPDIDRLLAQPGP